MRFPTTFETILKDYGVTLIGQSNKQISFTRENVKLLDMKVIIKVTIK